MNSLKPISSAKTADAAAKSASAGAASPSPRAALPSNKAASLAFLMSIDHSASTVHTKHSSDSPKGAPTSASPVALLAAAAASTSAAGSKPEHPSAVPQLYKSFIQKIPAGVTPQQSQSLSAPPGQSRNKGAATAAAASAAVITAPPAQPSRVRQRSDEDHGNIMNPSAFLQPLSSASPRLSSLLGSELKKRKSSR